MANDFVLDPEGVPNYSGPPQVGALTAQGGPADTRGVVPGLQSSLEQQNKLINEFYAPRVKMYEDLTAKLAARRAGPPLSERLAQYSAALAQPTKYSGPGAMFGAISSVFADQQKAQREERLANEDLATKYQMARMGEEENRFDKRMSAAEKMRALQLQYLTKTGKKPPLGKVMFSPTTGIAAHPYLGTPLKAADQAQVNWLLAAQSNPDPQLRERAKALFNAEVGMGAAEQYIDYFNRDVPNTMPDDDTDTGE